MNDIISAFLSLAPADYAGIIMSGWAFFVAICAFAAKHWPRPADGSRWLILYTLVNVIGQNTQHAANADDKGTGK